MVTTRQMLLAGGLSAALAVSGGLAVTASGATGTAAAPATTSASPSATLTQDLQFSIEEERMARDLYTHFAEKYDGARPFANIRYSEQRHVDNVTALMRTYKVTDPGAGKPAGQYASADVQKLYDTWKAQGDASLSEAIKVGVALEKRDIADLKQVIGRTTATDAKAVFSRLLMASEHHLAAFEARANGTTPSTGRGPGGPGGRQGRQPGQGMRQGGGQGMRQGQGMRGHGPGMQGQGRGAAGQRAADCPLVDAT